MKLTQVESECKSGTCPTLYATDRDSYVLQGYVITDPEALAALSLPSGESAVEIPASLMERFAHAVAR
ncbi:hypothetical protein R8Z50_30895 [Longispora sp. K20-0274]|uniref:hypothetical protein n=1 Tax=Longispora sp. K20-0274 TaxID=3088255 RepID=UPI00399A0D6E